MEENVTFAKEDVDTITNVQSITAGKEPEGETANVEEKAKEEAPEEAKEAKTEVLEEEVKEPEVEAPKEEPKDKFKEFEEQWAKKFSALSRREKYLSKKEREEKDKGRLSDSAKNELEELRRFKQEFEANPYGIMDKQGYTYENWTKKILEGDLTPVPSQTPKEIEEIKSELEKIKKERETQNQGMIQAQRQQTYQNQMNEIEKVITEHSEDFPLVNVFGDAQIVFDVMAEKYKQDATEFDEEYAMENLMPIEEAAKHTETWRENVLKERKIAIDPFKKKLGLLFSDSEPSEEQKALKEIEEKESASVSSKLQNGGSLPEKTRQILGVPKRAKTLTNEQQTTIPAREDKPFKTEQERIDHAARFLSHS